MRNESNTLIEIKTSMQSWQNVSADAKLIEETFL